jgi:hypothetical protein
LQKQKAVAPPLRPFFSPCSAFPGGRALAQDPINEGNSNKAGIVPSDYIQSAEGAEDSKEQGTES